MSAMGGRLGAYRDALARADDGELAEAARRNIGLIEGTSPAPLAGALRALHQRLCDTESARVLAGEI